MLSHLRFKLHTETINGLETHGGASHLRSVIVVNYSTISFNYLLTTVRGGGGDISVIRATTQVTICANEIKPIKAAFKNLITLFSEIEKGLEQN